MTTETLESLFEKHSGEYLKFAKVQNKRSNRADLHAFMLLDSLVSGKEDIVSSSHHDYFWLSINIHDLAQVITEEQVIELIRCGVRFDGECFKMFS